MSRRINEGAGEDFVLTQFHLYSVFGYVTTPEEANHYVPEVWGAVKSGLFKIRIVTLHPFTAEGLRDAQKEITTPGGKLAGKILLKVSEE